MSDTDMNELSRAVQHARRHSLLMLTAASGAAFLVVGVAAWLLAGA